MAEKKLKILVIDDDELMCRVMEGRLRQFGFDIRWAVDSQKAAQLVELDQPEIVISDVVMPGLSGLDLLSSLKKGNAQRVVILVTGHATVDMAVEAMKQGAHDFITKPIDYDNLKSILDAATRDLRLEDESRKLSGELKKGANFADFIGTSKPMKMVYTMIQTLAGTNASVLIAGESGTGKELVAQAIHALGNRARNPFIALNAAAIPKDLMESELFGHEKGAFTGATQRRAGCFELANQGTLFLDEIGEMPLALQPKLLRVLEDGKVRRLGGKQEYEFDVRVLAATNREPRKAVEVGDIREDLYYRLNVFSIELPPLRDRGDDIALLAQHFLATFNKKHGTAVKGLREDTVETLLSYEWPGNVRELKNIMERAVVLSGKGWIEVSHLPPYVQGAKKEAEIVLPVGITIAEAEKQLITKTLAETGYNKSETARRLGLDVKTVRYKLKSYGITEPTT